jgi:hypothetical protein
LDKRDDDHETLRKSSSATFDLISWILSVEGARLAT